ncbi:hypothetical protein TNIN_231701 [Trichonephila inaurata madagascariensis]|uniref:Uncharacterized protein n=1 Tax=Trichonephila inaurata madagascariensis TaxID=2747483 RepID=A0A8X7C081_9ARAC|nr:hypothetical protein TNIN_231701 [Trichonephila inaurata madagascariensis]
MQNNQDSDEIKRKRKLLKANPSFHRIICKTKTKEIETIILFSSCRSTQKRKGKKNKRRQSPSPFLITDDDCEKVPHQTATDNSIRREHQSPQLLQNIAQAITSVLCAPGLVIGHDVLPRWLGRAPRWVQRASDYLDRDAGRQVHSKCSSESLKHDRQPKGVAPIKSFVAIGRSLHGCSDSFSLAFFIKWISSSGCFCVSLFFER